MATKECPCRYCVAPKRHQGCHTTCKEWEEWKSSEEVRNQKIREMRAQDEDCFPVHRTPIRKRRMS